MHGNRLPKASESRLNRGLKGYTFDWIFGKSHSNYKVEWRVDALPAPNEAAAASELTAQRPAGARSDTPYNGLRALLRRHRILMFGFLRRYISTDL
ncbi:MAG: hypothetical protein V4578_21430, partial [Pseudomonadota bacterium]